MFYVYCIASKSMNKSYIGMSKNVRERIHCHHHKHKEWFTRGYTLEIVSRHRLLSAAITAESKAMVARNTLAPNGLNMHEGGAIGHILTRLSEKDRRAIKARHTQYARDKRAMLWLKKLPNAPTRKAERARHVRAWKRSKNGLPPIPGTEHYLQQPEFWRRPKASAETRTKMVAAQKARNAKLRQQGIDLVALYGVKGPKHTAEFKERLAATRVRERIAKGGRLSFALIRKKIYEARARKNAGRDCVPGTEIFLLLDPSPMGTSRALAAERRQVHEQIIDKVHKWERAYAIKQGWRDS